MNSPRTVPVGARRRFPRRLVAILPVLVGLVLAAVLVETRGGSPRRPAVERSQLVRVVAAREVNVVPRAIGYGRIRPALTWTGTAEVAGRILETHALYAIGALVPAGTELVRIDPVDYELAIEELTEALEDLRALVDETDAQRVNDEALLRIEERSLTLAEKELERQRELLATSATSQGALDEVERRTLAQRATVQRLRNSLRLIPVRRRSLEARVASQKARLAAAVRDLGRTRIVTPFDVRITSVQAQKGAYVTKGARLVNTDATASLEVAAQFRIDRIRRLLPEGERLEVAPGTPGLPERLGLSASVRLRDGEFVVEWDARFERIDASLDPRSNTVGFIVVVDEPYEKARTGLRPPLMRGMFAEVELRSATPRRGVVIPRAALDGDHAWVLDGENRMRRRRVGVTYAQGEFVAVSDGVAVGELVVVSDPVPALDGALVRPRTDDALLSRIVAEAEGRGEHAVIRFCAAHPTAANLLMLILLAMGALTVRKLQRETFPDFSPREIEIRVTYPGATAADVEHAVCVRIEDVLDGVSEVRELRSEAKDGVAVVVVEMKAGGDFRTFSDEIRTEVDAIDDFPAAAEPAVVRELHRTDPVISIAVTGEAGPNDLKAYCEDLKRRLARDAGIALVRIDGFSDHQFRVELSQEALLKHGLTIEDVVRKIGTQSVDLPAGTIETPERDVVLRFTDERRTSLELASLVVLTGDRGAELRLGDIATVTERFERDEDRILFDGRRAGLLKVSKTKSEDSLDVNERVRAFLEEERARAPSGVTLFLTEDFTSIVRDRLEMLVVNGLQGLALVFGTMWLFFGLRYSFWVAMGLPVAFLGALFFLPPLDQSINMMSMVALLLAIGLLMDDAIVIAENIATHLRKGKSALEAAIDGTAEVKWGVLSSFLTTVAVFGPLSFLAGDIGMVLRPIPIVLIVVLGVSLVEAFLILPHHLAHSLSRREERPPGRFRRWFERGVEWVRETVLGTVVDRILRWRYVTLGVVLGLFLFTVGLVAGGRAKFQAFPDIDGDVILARVLMPPGTPLRRAEEVASRLTRGLAEVGEDLASRQPEGERLVRSVSVQLGRNVDAHESGPHVLTVSADLLSADRRDAPIDELLSRWREKTGPLPDVISIRFAEPAFGPAGWPIFIRLRGDDLDELERASLEVREWLGTFPGVLDLSDDLRRGKPELRLRLTSGALDRGFDARTVADQLRGAFHGRTASEIQVGIEEYEIDVRLAAADRDGFADLDRFHLKGPEGHPVPLEAVATVERARGWARIARVDGSRTVSIQADVDTSTSNTAEILGEFERGFLPGFEERFPEVRVDIEGEVAESATTRSSMLTGMAIGVLGVFVLLSFQFRSFVEPLIVMVAIPLALIGVVWGHLLMGLNLSMPSLLGLVSLAGIVVNDSILLVVFVKTRRREGLSVEEAAGRASRDRFRAVLLTSLTTITGLIPLLVERSLQAQILIPLATSIVFGLLASTMLILLVIPALYGILDDLGLARRTPGSGADAAS